MELLCAYEDDKVGVEALLPTLGSPHQRFLGFLQDLGFDLPMLPLLPLQEIHT